MEYQCKYCGKKTDMPLAWATPRMCGNCQPKEKPCPFCGVWGAMFYVHDEADPSFYLECAVCKARGPRGELKELALHNWNRRKEAIEPPVLPK
jgi:Lar family restriction alleviation protein